MMLRTWSKLAVLLLTACSSDGRTVLTVYSPHGKDLLKHFEDGFEKAKVTQIERGTPGCLVMNPRLSST